MKERIKELRKTLGKTQTEFGAAIGIKGNTVTNYENGLRNPSDAIINSICREFNVNETWLRTGEGDMFKPLTRSETIAKFAGELMKDEEDSFRRRLIELLSELNEDEWVLIENLAKKLAKKID